MDDVMEMTLGDAIEAVSRIAGIRQAMLGPFAAAAGEAPGPVAAAFCAALSSLSTARLISQGDEETTTAAMLGAMIAGFQSARHAFSARRYPTPRFCWAGYRKGRTNLVFEGESHRGADFALVVWTSPTTARLALFQAKRTETGIDDKKLVFKNLKAKPGRQLLAAMLPGANEAKLRTFPFGRGQQFLDVHRRPPRKGKLLPDWRATQMKHLRRTAELFTVAVSLSADGGVTPGIRSALDAMQAEASVRVSDGSEGNESEVVAQDSDIELLRATRNAADDAFRQLVLKHFDSIVDSEDEAAFAKANVHWIHYLAYLREPEQARDAEAASGTATPSSIVGEDVVSFSDSAAGDTLKEAPAVCVPLLGLWPWLEVERKLEADEENFLDLADVHAYRFSDILLGGIEPLEGVREGWLELNGSVLRALLPRLQDVCEVLMADEHGGIERTFGSKPDSTPPAPSNDGGTPTPPTAGPGQGGAEFRAARTLAGAARDRGYAFSAGPGPDALRLLSRRIPKVNVGPISSLPSRTQGKSENADLPPEDPLGSGPKSGLKSPKQR